MTNQEKFSIYQDISNQIQEESDAYFSVLLSTIAGCDQGSDLYSWRDHELRMIFLRCKRIAICVELALITEDAASAISEDFEKLIESVAHIQIKSNADDGVISDTLDCILSIAGDNFSISDLTAMLPEKYSGIRVIENTISEALYDVLTDLAIFIYAQGDASVAIHVLLYLVKISRERNISYIDWHREIVVNVMEMLGDSCVDERYQICVSETDKFKGSHDEYTAEFLWLSGCTFQVKGKTNEARNAFYRCYRLRKKIYGEDHWVTAAAIVEYFIISLTAGIDEEENCRNLERFINKIDENAYGSVDRQTLEKIEGRTIYAVLLYKINHNDFSSYEHFARRYESVCSDFNMDPSEPLIKLRLSYNFLGEFYRKKQNYIMAEQFFKNAADADYPPDADETLTINQVKINLLITYCVENDMEYAVPLLLELLECIDEENSGLEEIDKYKVLSLYNNLITQSLLETDEEEIEYLISELDEVSLQICGDDFQQNYVGREMIIFFITGVQLLIQNGCLTIKQRENYCNGLLKIENNCFQLLEQGQKVVLLSVLSTLAWETMKPDLAERTILKAVQLIDDAIVPLSTKASVLHTAADILSRNGKERSALRYLNRALVHITEIWHSYMRYFNDDRLLQILSPAQLLFTCSYAIMRDTESDVRRLYERILNFKAMASLAGKERNRILNTGKFDTNLAGRIKVIQDRLAAIEAENIFLPESETYREEKENLRRLEAQFSARFPDNVKTTELSVKKLQEKMPDNTVIIEYLLCVNNNAGDGIDEETDLLMFDAFVVTKKNGNFSITRRSVRQTNLVSEDAVEFVGAIIDESKGNATIDQIERKEVLRRSLYDALIAPVVDLISEYNQIFIAPDADIMNLPFDVLADERGILLGDRFNIVIIECARDFLFSDNGFTGQGSLIIGNPQFDIPEKTPDEKDIDEREQDRSRFSELDPEKIGQLPFSEFEVRLASKYCKSRYLVGKEASRYQLINSKGKRNIHLATHGYFDLSEESVSIYSSCLLFSGVCNWLRANGSSSEYGSGIVTADEISRLNFHDIELVVLSSCLSGINDATAAKGFQGLIGGFSAAGVKYVISNIWNADDLATTILMEVFYYQYCTQNVAPPLALKRAKQYLRNVTIGDLKKRKWFEYVLQGNVLNEKMKEKIRVYAGKNDRFKPFKNEIYWSGFTCFRCN